MDAAALAGVSPQRRVAAGRDATERVSVVKPMPQGKQCKSCTFSLASGIERNESRHDVSRLVRRDHGDLNIPDRQAIPSLDWSGRIRGER